MRTKEFYVPSGYKYIIREQNGEDEEILSNVPDFKSLMNFTKFISSIVVETDFTQSGKVTIEDALRMPVNDRYVILFQSRIFSIGETVEFEYTWPSGDKVLYEQDITEFLFNDYSQDPTIEELEAKPDAIPYYPYQKKTEFEFTTDEGHQLKFNLLTGGGEKKMVTMPSDKQTRNSPLLCRNLQLMVNGNYEAVKNFKMFTVKEMHQIRKEVFTLDPIFTGSTDITNPNNDTESTKFPIITAPGFFFLTED